MNDNEISWFLVDVGYACAGIVVKNNIVVEAAPIYKWMVDKDVNNIRKWKKIKRITSV